MEVFCAPASTAEHLSSEWMVQLDSNRLLLAGRTKPMQDAVSCLEKGMIHLSEMETGFTPVLKMLKYKAEVQIRSLILVELLSLPDKKN